MAFAHGSNDAQKSMGIITLALLSGGYIGVIEEFFISEINSNKFFAFFLLTLFGKSFAVPL